MFDVDKYVFVEAELGVLFFGRRKGRFVGFIDDRGSPGKITTWFGHVRG